MAECSLGWCRAHSVFSTLGPRVRIHSASLPLPDTTRKRHLCKGHLFFLAWEPSPVPCSRVPAQTFPGNWLSQEEQEVGEMCPSWEEGTSPPPPSADSSDPPSPDQGGKGSALCLHVLLLPWKTQPWAEEHMRKQNYLFLTTNWPSQRPLSWGLTGQQWFINERLGYKSVLLIQELVWGVPVQRWQELPLAAE